MQDHRREILTQVASGVISAEEGAARLEALDSPTPSPAAVQAPPQPAALPPAAAARGAVRVVSQFGAADVIGDATVAFAVADGPHQVRQDGDVMVIEHEPFGESETFTFGREGRFLNDVRARRLVVRMNPELALSASVQAGSVRIEGVHGPITAEVQAGNCKLGDFRGPLDVSVQAGNVSASGRLESGTSRVRCEMGSVKINFERGSSVRIKARTTMGKISIDGTATRQSDREVVIGAGAATLDVECTMGNVKVSAE